MGQVTTRLSAIEGRALTPLSEAPLYGIPGYGGIPSAPPASATVVHTSSSRPISITQIQFPHSPSSLPHMGASSSVMPGAVDDEPDAVGVPCFYKLSFPSFDGNDDPLGWLNRCEHFFRAQRTRDADKVRLA